MNGRRVAAVVLPGFRVALVRARSPEISPRDPLAVVVSADRTEHSISGGTRIDEVSDEARARAVLKKQFSSTDQSIIDINYTEFKEQTPINAEIDIEGARAIIEQIAKPGASRRIDDYVDLGLLDALKSQGFFDAAARK